MPNREKQEKLLDSLDDLFLAEGFKGITVSQLAERLHCSKRTLYQLAPSRQALVDRVVARNYRKRLAESRATCDGIADPQRRMAAFFADIQNRNDQRRERFLRDVIATPSTNRIRIKHVGRILSMLEDMLSEGIDSGLFRKQNAPITTSLGLGLLQTIADPDIAERLGYDYSTLFEETLDIFFNGVLTRRAN